MTQSGALHCGASSEKTMITIPGDACQRKRAWLRRLLPPDVEVGRGKQREVLEAIKVVDRQGPVAQHDQAAAAKLLDGPVDMHHRKAGCISEIHLGDRKGAAVAVKQAY